MQHLRLLFELCRLPRTILVLCYNSNEVLGEHEGHALAVDAELLLAVVEEMAEIDVEYL